MIRLEVAKHAVGSMNYLFLQHVVGDPFVTKDEVLEGELYTFFSLISSPKFQQNPIDKASVAQFLSSKIEQELRDGEYFEQFNPNKLKERVEESLYIIMGMASSEIADLYHTCIDHAHHFIASEKLHA